MSYDLSSIDTTRKSSPYISYGSNQILKVNKIELIHSQNTGSPKAVLHMETGPVSEEGFTPIEGHKGKVGKVACGVYMKTEDQKKEFLRKMKMIAEAMDLDEQFNSIKGNIFEDVVKKIEDVIIRNGKFARFTIFGEQYAKSDAKIGLRLMFPRFGFVESLEIKDEESRIIKFDINNPGHYKKIQKVESQSEIDDLPF